MHAQTMDVTEWEGGGGRFSATVECATVASGSPRAAVVSGGKAVMTGGGTYSQAKAAQTARAPITMKIGMGNLRGGRWGTGA
jgi:hypothetical protein